MKEWKAAYSIAALELNASKLHFIYGFLLFLFIALYLYTELSSYIDNGFVGYDFFFILLFGLGTIWMKPKEFQSKKVKGDLLISPIFLMQTQLPIVANTLIKSRFIIHFFYTFPYQVIGLVGLYLLTDLHNMLHLGNFIAFSIIWLSFNFYIGGVFPASDSGERGVFTTNPAVIITGVLLLISLFILFTAIHILFGNGIVYWTIVIAQKSPILASMVSIVLAFIGLNYWQHYTRKRMDKIDYL